MSRRSENPETGITLIELVVVLAVFALVATMGIAALSGSLRNRDKLVALDGQTGDIARAISLLRGDLKNGIGIVFHDPNGTVQSAFDIDPDGNGFSVSRAGMIDFPGQSTAGIGRVVWRVDQASQTLRRQNWPVLIPADQASKSPEVVVASGITGMTLRSYRRDTGWITGVDPNLRGTSGKLPAAIDVILDTANLGRINLIVAQP